MLNWLFDLVFGKDLKKELSKTKKIKAAGFRFVIRRISPLDHLTGSKVLLQSYDVLKMNQNTAEVEKSEKKIKEHMKDVILAGVVEPKLSSKEDGEGLFVDQLFVDMNLINDLYAQIIEYTFGKKKIRLSK